MRALAVFALCLLSGALCLGTVRAGVPDADARVKVWITLADKGPLGKAPAPQAPASTHRAHEDAPVHAPYLERLRAEGVEVSVVLRWQNRVSAWVDPARLVSVRALPFVRSVEELPRKAPTSPADGAPLRRRAEDPPVPEFGAFSTLFQATGAAALRDTVAARGLTPGEGVRVAIMDSDFHLGHLAFDSLFARGAIVDQYDFVADSAETVTRAMAYSHGAMVLSQIGGHLPGTLQGLAPRATFLLYRTEDVPTERYAEEDFLAAAIERATDSGAQVISISLGYRFDFDAEPDVPFAEMDGRTRPSSLAALGAARRGVLVVTSVGNEGIRRSGRPTLTAPADADSILAVGILGVSGVRCSYSSTGPSADGRIKPELASLGCAVPVANATTAATVYNQGGTSFAAPVVAGIAALLRQLHPDSAGVNAQTIRAALLQSAQGAAAPDTFVGHGLVSAAAAHCRLAFGGACPEPPRLLAAKGMYVWRGGPLAELEWPNALDTDRVRAWDFQGRRIPLRARPTAEGDILLQSEGRRAPGPLLLRIPVE